MRRSETLLRKPKLHTLMRRLAPALVAPMRMTESKSQHASVRAKDALRFRGWYRGWGIQETARYRYNDLTVAELATVETPDHGVVSWRRRGILTQYHPRTHDMERQTPGFPEYATQKMEIFRLARRWVPLETEYRTMLDARPWVDLWNKRIKFFYFHRLSKLTSKEIVVLDEYLDIYDGAALLHAERANRRDLFSRNLEENMNDFFQRGLPASMLYEPGVWPYPVKLCPLYLTDVSTVNEQSRPYSLAEQIRMAEEEEPARAQ
ncbi:hypothetical protein JG688_00012936 [Phytophthora aleatoria]|uniref:Uncharacterized protein n=1 Tax=Phytophthora aleatoria TaxID=2496075 RepID=A0A8J5IJU9_9STRA|nr:hypothetical protein JG688_00012936 [Phytophthora aleatoria]